VELASQIAPGIVGQARLLAKRWVMAVLHSPPMIPNLGGSPIRGVLRAAFIGDTRTGKSEIVKDICPVKGQPQRLEAGRLRR